jgi:hypothetical protein
MIRERIQVRGENLSAPTVILEATAEILLPPEVLSSTS